jgi:excisionase family DNA binding protein
MESESLTVPQAAERLGVTEQTIQRWLRLGKLEGTMLGGRAGWRIPSYSVATLLTRGEVAGPEGEMLDRQYAYLSPSYARYATHIDRGGAVAVNLRWLADIVMALQDAGVQLSELDDEAPFAEPPRKAPRFVALRNALESVRITRDK